MPSQSISNKLNLGYYCYPVRTLGPVDRFAIWTKGCNRRCYRCASPDLQPTTGGTAYSISDLIALMMKSNCNGLTISGGEPLLQTQPLLELLQDVRKTLPRWDIILFTGFLFDEIELNIRSELMNLVDLLIDGPYIDELNDNVGLRGSSNQKLHFFTSRLSPVFSELNSSPRPPRQLFLLSYEEMISVGIAPRLSTSQQHHRI